MLLVALCFLTPPFQTPDEHRHFFRAYQLSEGVLYPYSREPHISDGQTVQQLHTPIGGALPEAIDGLLIATSADRLRFDSTQRVTVEQLMAAFEIRADTARRVFLRFPHTAVYPPYVYGPQAIGILLARAFTDRVLAQFYVARVVNALSALAFMVIALRVAPSLWPIISAFCALPMVSFQIGSLSPDAMVLGASAAYGALWLSGAATLSATIVQSSALTVIIAKPAYAPLALPVLFGPDRRPILTRVAIVSVALVPLALWLVLAAGSLGPVRTDFDLSLRRQIVTVIADPVRYFIVACANLLDTAPWYAATMVGALGWGTRPISLPHLLLAYALTAVGVLLSNPPGGPASFRKIAILLVASAVSVALVQLALYLSYTPVGASYIDGMQGRYFLPVFLLCLMTFVGQFGLTGRNVTGFFSAGLAVSVLLTLISVLQSYYG
jgi:uncharacterized membrane protein